MFREGVVGSGVLVGVGPNTPGAHRPDRDDENDGVGSETDQEARGEVRMKQLKDLGL